MAVKAASVFAAAEAHRLADRLADADRSYRAVLKDTPKHVNALRGLALVLERQGREDAAAAERGRAERLDAASLVTGAKGLFKLAVCRT